MDADMLVTSAQNSKNVTFGNLKTVTQEGNMETGHTNPFLFTL